MAKRHRYNWQINQHHLARGIAPWVVGQWLAFVLLTALQPCCEVIASTIPHEHGRDTSDDTAHTQHAHNAHEPAIPANTATPDPTPHEHCGSGDSLKSIVPEALTAPHLPMSELDLGPLSHEVHDRQDSLVPTVSSPIVERERGPPLPVYLATLRLRI